MSSSPSKVRPGAGMLSSITSEMLSNLVYLPLVNRKIGKPKKKKRERRNIKELNVIESWCGFNLKHFILKNLYS